MGDAPVITEKDRVAHVTSAVQEWILGNGDHLPQALIYAHADETGERLGNYLRGVLYRPAWGTTTYQVRMDLSERDVIERVRWDLIAKRLARHVTSG